MADSSAIFRTVGQAVRIEDIVGESIALKPAGRELVGLCPFHNDRRPSMRVSPQKQIFHCFVCATGGDAFKFVQLYHKMTPGESLRFLAQRAGIVLPEFNSDGKGRSESKGREKLAEINEWACAWFEKTLHGDAGKGARGYLKSRGLTEETIKAFRLGFAPDAWNALAEAAGRRGLSAQELLDSGLVRRRNDGGVYDVFRNRAIFPISDAAGRIIGFGGRIMAEAPVTDDASGQNQTPPKYLNSPETALFVKKESLYGLEQARPTIVRRQSAVLVEGYMDVIACHQAGVANVIATLGTALTREHARQLRRYCKTVILVFDSDDAGRRAADRALDIFLREPLDVKVTSVPDGKDPCDFCMTHGGAAFEGILTEATDALAFQWRRLQGQFSGSDSLAGKQEAAKALLAFVRVALEGQRDDLIRQALLVRQLADLIGMSEQDVQKALRQQPAERRFDDVDSSESPAVVAPGTSKPTGRQVAEQWLIGALLTEPGLYAAARDGIALDLFDPDGLQPLAQQLLSYLEDATDLQHCALADFLSQLEDHALVNQAILAQATAESGGSVDRKLTDALRWLHDQETLKSAEAPGENQDTFNRALASAKQQQAAPTPRRVFGPRQR